MSQGSIPAQPAGSARVVVSAEGKVVRVFEGKSTEELQRDASELVNFLKSEGKQSVETKTLKPISG